jgi:hypothetical protein
VGHLEWHLGRTENVSASGVLVQVPDPLNVDTLVEFQLALASMTAVRPNGEVSGIGRVVRVVPPSDRQTAGIAIAIDQYDFRPPPRPEKTALRD